MIHARKDYQRIQDPLTNEKEGKGIKKDEPVFLLRSKDVLFVPMLRVYALLSSLVGADMKLIQSVNSHAELARLWQMSNPPKVADL